jgi:hypothetical protein
MDFQFDMSATSFPALNAPPPPASEVHAVLTQMLEVQREQLNSLRSLVGVHDGGLRWRAFLDRWRKDFSDLPEACRQALPILERTYGKLIAELTDYLSQNGPDALENDFALQEFVDRYGMRLTQLGTLLALVAPLAEVRSPTEST